MINEKKDGVLKTLLIVIGAIVSVAAIAAALYLLFKKYFKVTFECGDCDECDCNGCFVEEDDKDYEPICDCEESAEEN